MEPRIQYAKTADGVSIAYYSLGSGPAVIFVQLPNTNIQFEWQVPEVRSGIEAASALCTYVRYDPRGFGMSAEAILEFSLDSLILDLEAVVDHLALARFALVGVAFAVPVAAAYAARNQDRVSKLVLWQGWDRGEDMPNKRVIDLLEGSSDDWEFATEAMWHAYQGWDEDVAARCSAAFMRAAAPPNVILNFLRQASTWDVSGDLRQIGMPTLVLREPERYSTSDVGARMAKLIPKAELVVLKGSQEERFRGGLAAIGRFLFGELPSGPRRPVPHSMTAILFADIAESTALTERLGDAAFRERARALDGALRGVIRENGGTPVEGKLLGDGVLAVFTSARQAIEAALACGRAGDDAGLPLHLGLHAGDVIREEEPDGRGNVYGGAVNIAARVSALSSPGEVLVSDTVRSLARTSASVTFEDRGEHSLKGVEEPQRLFAVRGGG